MGVERESKDLNVKMLLVPEILGWSVGLEGMVLIIKWE